MDVKRQIFVSTVWLSSGSTALKLDLSAVGTKFSAPFVPVFMPGAASCKLFLSEGAVCGLASLWRGGAHGPAKHIDSSDMKSCKT